MPDQGHACLGCSRTIESPEAKRVRKAFRPSIREESLLNEAFDLHIRYQSVVLKESERVDGHPCGNLHEGGTTPGTFVLGAL